MTWLRAKSRRGIWAKILSTTIACAVLMAVQPASAEVGKEQADASAKGAVGLALLGAEAVISVEALIGVKKWWAYAIGGGVGAAGGAVGGYFLDKADKPAVSMGLLVGGLVLAIPTTIALLSATAYKPPTNPEIDDSTARAFERFHAARFRAPPSAFALTDEGKFKLAIPAVSVVPVYSRETAHIFALKNGTSVRVPVFNLSF